MKMKIKKHLRTILLGFVIIIGVVLCIAVLLAILYLGEKYANIWEFIRVLGGGFILVVLAWCFGTLYETKEYFKDKN